VVANATAESEAERRAEAARSTILDAVSHDMRGPITAIQTATGALQDDALPEPIRTELASAIATEADRLGRMVADLDDLATVESGAVRTDAGWCDLREIIARAIGTVRERRGEFPIRTDLAEDLSPVHADPRQMERVFTNLIENAAKFAPADTPVEVRGIRANGRVTIRVVDKGRGIPASQHSQVFKPFVRGRDAEPGAGLGLAICRGFVEANGGRITLQSRGREGAAFAVSFPAAPQPSVVG
jgi:two-component system sensor histidine kinase KdpD